MKHLASALWLRTVGIYKDIHAFRLLEYLYRGFERTQPGMDTVWTCSSRVRSSMSPISFFSWPRPTVRMEDTAILSSPNASEQRVDFVLDAPLPTSGLDQESACHLCAGRQQQRLHLHLRGVQKALHHALRSFAWHSVPRMDSQTFHGDHTALWCSSDRTIQSISRGWDGVNRVADQKHRQRSPTVMAS